MCNDSWIRRFDGCGPDHVKFRPWNCTRHELEGLQQDRASFPQMIFSHKQDPRRPGRAMHGIGWIVHACVYRDDFFGWLPEIGAKGLRKRVAHNPYSVSGSVDGLLAL